MQITLNKTSRASSSIPSASNGIQRETSARLSPLRIIAAAVVAGVLIGIVWELVSDSGTSHPLFKASFGSSGLITNEFAYQNPGAPLATNSPVWEVTSGSLFARDGTGWTGIPDGRAPGPQSGSTTGSAVFRLHTVRNNFKNVSVSFKLKISRFVSTPRTPAQAYDGVHIWLRYQSHDWLYFTSVARRDGQVVIGKKLPLGSSLQGGGAEAAGGIYFHEVRRPGHAFPLNTWQDVSATIQSAGDKVVVRLFINRHQIARLTDTRQAILQPGAVGIRGDNTEFQFKDFQVAAL